MKNHMEISIQQNASSFGIVRPEFISTTLDWWHLKSKGWGNSSVIHADLTHPNLIAAARGLGPFFLRIGGSFADIASYDMSNNNTTNTTLVGEAKRLAKACSKNRQLCLTRQRWDEILKFAHDTGARIFFTLAYIQHTKDDESGESDQRDWDSTNARQLLQYTAQSKYANTVFGFELGNELTHKHKIQNITRLVNAYKELRLVIDDAWSATNDNYIHKPKILGPASIGPSQTTKLLKALGSHIDIATYHKYHGGGKDPSIIKHAKGPSIIQHPRNFHELSNAVNKYMDTQPEVWIGEGAMAFNSGRQNLTDSFVGSFWFTNMLGAISKSRPHTVYCRQALVGGYYELISHETMKARPDYWIAYLWKKLVGTKAIGPILSPHRIDSVDEYTFGCCKGPGYDTLLLHAFCSKEETANPIFIITNIDKKTPFSLNITVGTHITKYILTGKGGRRDSRSVILNGNQLLKIGNGKLPEIVGEDTDELVITLPPVSIAFVIVRGFQVDECAPSMVAAANEPVQIQHVSSSSMVEHPQVSSEGTVPFIASESEMQQPVTIREVRQLALAQLLFAIVFFAFIFYLRKRIQKSRKI